MEGRFVRTKYGIIAGIEKDKVVIFKGVPYARPPIEDLRFREPEEPVSWEGIRECNRFADIPFQPEGWVGEKALEENKQSEDCLYLNIWAPMKNKNAELPVLVWIHGGGFQGGCAHEGLYDGMEFAKRNIVVVSISYRLGVFGFLAHSGFSEESVHHAGGNYGILDQIQALKWVHENIAEFGGDPQNVTIMGQSAGGMSVACLMTSPLAKGLFHKAIIQSGGPKPKQFPDFTEIEEQCKLLMEKLQISDYRELRKADAKVLTQMKMPLMSGGLPYQPVIDKYVLPEDPYEAFESGRIHQVPLLIGNTVDETVFSPLLNTCQSAFEKSVIEYFGDMAQEFYDIYQSECDWKTAAAMAGKDFSFYHIQNLTDQMLKTFKSEVYRYVFGQPLILEDGTVLGAGHSSELFFVFNTLPCRNTALDGTRLKVKNSDQDKALSRAINEYWAEFVKTGTPYAENCPIWESIASGGYMNFHEREFKMKKNATGEKQALWSKALNSNLKRSEN